MRNRIQRYRNARRIRRVLRGKFRLTSIRHMLLDVRLIDRYLSR